MVGVDQLFAGVLEVDGDAGADDSLHLPQTPVVPAGMAHQNAGLDKGVNHRLSLT